VVSPSQVAEFSSACWNSRFRVQPLFVEDRMVSHVRWKATLLAAAFVAALMPASAQAQATGIVEGRVTEQGSGRPLTGAQVFVAGTTVGTVSAANGTFRIVGAPARTVEGRDERPARGEQVVERVHLVLGREVPAALPLREGRPTHLEALRGLALGQACSIAEFAQ